MIRRALEWVAGGLLWPFQALFFRWDDWHQLGEWADRSLTTKTTRTTPGGPLRWMSSDGVPAARRRALRAFWSSRVHAAHRRPWDE